MTRYFPFAFVSVLFGLWHTSAWAGACYDLANHQPSELTGTLEYVMFPGPPNYEDIQKGDTPEPEYILKLQDPICITGDDFADPNNQFQAVQLSAEKEESFRAFLHKNVTVQLTNQAAAETGHVHEPLIAAVTSIVPVQAKPMDFTDEYGTAATTIRAFYTALHDAQGADAAAMVIPEKRTMPAFSPSNLTRFYGSLTDPITMLDIAQENDSTFIVHYHYAIKSRVCDGRATVTTAMRDGRNYIQGIKAMNGC